MSKKGNKKRSCHLVPKVVIDLPFEGRKIEGRRKYRRRERVPKAGSRREETINEPIGYDENLRHEIHAAVFFILHFFRAEIFRKAQ